MKNRTILITVLIVLLSFGVAGCTGSKDRDNSYLNRQETQLEENDTDASSSVTQSSNDDDEQVEIPVPDPTIRIVATGDILLGRGVERALKKSGKDYDFVFKEVEELLKQGDIVFGNLEGPLTDSEHSLTGISDGGKYILRSRPAALDSIKAAGFNLLSLANNHILDYYEAGLFDTMRLLSDSGIAFAGAGENIEAARKPAIIEVKGVRVGLLAYTDMAEIVYGGSPNLSFVAGEKKAGVAPRKLDHILEDIENVRENVDLLMISLHWGIEESFKVQPQQREFAYRLLDNGADMIIGHHPHQCQGIEIYKGKPIIYSLGNFIFDQNDPENQQSFIINLEYSEKQLKQFTAIPVKTLGKCSVVPTSGSETSVVIEREMNLSRNFGTLCEAIDNRIAFTIEK